MITRFLVYSVSLILFVVTMQSCNQQTDEPPAIIAGDSSLASSSFPDSITILTANLGNLSPKCRRFMNNLCDKNVEQRIAASIRQLRPDIVAFQEVMAPSQCADDETQLSVCGLEDNGPQVRRLVGQEYSLVCDVRNGYECVGIHVDVGEILDCPRGDMCVNARTVGPIDGCDNGFTASVATVQLDTNDRFDLANIHLQSSSDLCRIQLLNSLLDENDRSPVLIERNAIITGDFNLDPWRDSSQSASVWEDKRRSGWHGSSFQYLSGISERDPPYFTSFPFRKTVDFVVSNFAAGQSVVLGESPGTSRLDGGSGMDHRAIFTILRISEEASR